MSVLRRTVDHARPQQPARPDRESEHIRLIVAEFYDAGSWTRTRAFSRLVSSVGYLAGPAVVRKGLADPRIGIPDQLEQPRPDPVVVGLDVAGAQVPARELADPALLAAGQFQESV